MTRGVPRSNASRSSSRTTRTPPSEVSITMLRHSRLKSSTMARMRKRRPALSVSETKSSDPRWLMATVRTIGARVPSARWRPPRWLTANDLRQPSIPCQEHSLLLTVIAVPIIDGGDRASTWFRISRRPAAHPVPLAEELWACAGLERRVETGLTERPNEIATDPCAAGQRLRPPCRVRGQQRNSVSAVLLDRGN